MSDLPDMHAAHDVPPPRQPQPRPLPVRGQRRGMQPPMIPQTQAAPEHEQHRPVVPDDEPQEGYIPFLGNEPLPSFLPPEPMVIMERRKKVKVRVNYVSGGFDEFIAVSWEVTNAAFVLDTKKGQVIVIPWADIKRITTKRMVK